MVGCLAILWAVLFIEKHAASIDRGAGSMVFARASLVAATLRPNGSVRLLYYPRNLTPRTGIFLTRAFPDRRRDRPTLALIPRFTSIPAATPVAYSLQFHLLFPLILLLSLFVLWFAWPLVRRRRRRRRGQCGQCGYDLRGSVSQVCPECGSAELALHTKDDKRSIVK